MIIKGHNEVFGHIFKEFNISGYENHNSWFLLIRDKHANNHGGFQRGPLILLDNLIMACPNFEFDKRSYINALGPIQWRIESKYQGNDMPYLMISLRPIFYEYGIFEIKEIEAKSPFTNSQVKRFI